MDVVPIGDRRLWKTDPYVLEKKGDLLYGRGVEDNHHGIVSSYFAIKALQEEGVSPTYSVGRKARAIAGSVMEAILMRFNTRKINLS